MPRFKYDAIDLERFFVSDFARGEYETKSRIAKEIYRRYIQGSRRGGTRDIRVELRSKERRRKDIRADLWGLIERYEQWTTGVLKNGTPRAMSSSPTTIFHPCRTHEKCMNVCIIPPTIRSPPSLESPFSLPLRNTHVHTQIFIRPRVAASITFPLNIYIIRIRKVSIVSIRDERKTLKDNRPLFVP